MADRIEIPITTEGIMGLKQSVQVIIGAYKRYATSVTSDDESGIFPLVLGDLAGLKVDIIAGKDTLESFDNLTLDEIERPKNPFGDLTGYSDIDNLVGNYPISQSLYDEAREQVNEIFGTMKNREVPNEDVIEGGGFRKENQITKKESGEGKYGQTKPNANSESINSSEEENTPTKLVGGSSTSSTTSTTGGSYKDKSRGKFKDVIRNECIPCDVRLKGLDDIDITADLLGILEEMERRYRELIEQLKSLLTNTEIADDLCNLLNFLDFQCVPDLFSILALLLALWRKWSDVIPTLDGVFMQFIGLFFSPLLGGLSSILDKYIQMIMKPIDCVLNSLDTQLAKLDIERALSQNDVQEIASQRRREGYLRRKCEQLRERRAFLLGVADRNAPPPQVIGGRPRASIPSDGTGATTRGALDGILGTEPDSRRHKQVKFRVPGAVTTQEEINTLDTDIEACELDYEAEFGEGGENNITDLLKNKRDPKASTVRGLRNELSGFRNSLGSSLYELRNQILNGRRMVNDTLKVMRDELQRLIAGRAASSEEMLEGARNLQRIARLIGVVKTLMKLANKGKLCENNNNDPSIALGSFLTANRGTNTNNNYYNVFVGDNVDGERSLLIAPSDAVLELADEESDQITQLTDLDEINKLNRDGLPKELGDISNKRVTAVSSDLGVQVPVSLIAFDLCRNTDFSTQADIDRIQKWAVDAGLET